jgi:hypothetical protein
MMMFGFALLNKPVDIRQLRKKETWDSLIPISLVVDENARFSDRTCVLVQIKPTAEMTYRVYFARDLNYYPVHYTLSNQNEETDITANNLDVIDTAAGKVSMPIDLTYNKLSKKMDIKSTLTAKVKIGTLKINRDIDENAFTLLRSQVSTVLDKSDKKVYKYGVASPLAPAPRYESRSNAKFVILLCGPPLILLTLILVLKRLHRKS